MVVITSSRRSSCFLASGPRWYSLAHDVLKLDDSGAVSRSPDGSPPGPSPPGPSPPGLSPPIEPVLKTPAVLENAVSTLQREIVQDSPKRFRQLGKALIKNIKMKSLSRHRGGIQPNFFDMKPGPRPAFRGSGRQQEKRALKALTELGTFGDADGIRQITEILHSNPNYKSLKQSAEELQYRSATRDVGPKMYNGLGALAYATSRLPSTYAAVQNVFRRLQLSRKDSNWTPNTILDFGAGPGTAGWAARSVWPTAEISVTNVEASSSMADIGYQIAQLVGDSSESDFAPMKSRWVHSIPSKRHQLREMYDICVASYSLNELNGPVERHQLLNKLILSARDHIVLIEHGTPHGFSIIEDSRRYILKVSRKLGIPFHVATPCPHDGPCPLANSRSWCHFSQRHTRTIEQRVAVKSITGKAPRDTYSERFSYVVLKRGFRDELPDSSKLSFTSTPATSSPISIGSTDSNERIAVDIEPGLSISPRLPAMEDMISKIRNSRILRTRKRKGHVMMDLCSVLDSDGAYMGEGAGTILRQTVSKGKSKSSWDAGSAYKASKSLSQGDEWPLVFQARGHAIETPVIAPRTDDEDAASLDEEAELSILEGLLAGLDDDQEDVYP
jgi:ribosomal protein RSM22 (predicted rRNA methylase)